MVPRFPFRPPIFEWASDYPRSAWRHDLVAGATLAVMVVPQGMAYAIIAGLPPVYGLYASLVPTLVYALLGSTRKLAVGAVALDSLLLASGLGALGLTSGAEYLQAALLLTFLVGLAQVLMGLARMGFLAQLLARPVISGFTSAAALIIAASQLHTFFGIDAPAARGFLGRIGHVVAHFDDIHGPTVLMGLATIALILSLRRWNRAIPGALIALIASLAVVAGFGLEGQGVAVIGAVPGGLPGGSIPSMERDTLVSLLPTALTLALIGFAEAVTINRGLAQQGKDVEARPNYELVALGSANLLGSFFQAFPVTGGFSRTAVNVEAGARTPMASLFSVALVALTLGFLTPYFRSLPMAVLAGVILVAVKGLVDLRLPAQLWRYQRGEFALLAGTFLATLVLGITPGLVFGILSSLLGLVYRASRPHVAILGRIRGTDYFKNVDRFADDIETSEDILMLRFDGPVHFANLTYFRNQLLRAVARSPIAPRFLLLNAEGISHLDSSAIGMWERLLDRLESEGIAFVLVGANGPVRDLLGRYGLLERIGPNRVFVHMADAYAQCSGQSEGSEIQRRVALQTRDLST